MEIGTGRELQPGVHQITLALPMALNHVHCYLVEGREGYFLIDTGINSPEAFDTLARYFQQIGIRMGDIAGIAVTHFHPDHLGLAGQLKQLSGAPLIMHEWELERSKLIMDRFAGTDPDMVDLLITNGLPQEEFEKFGQARVDMLNGWLPGPLDRVEHLLRADEPLTVGGARYQALITPGHSNGHTCYYDPARNLLFSGDHILGKITPHIGIYSDEDKDHNPLIDYVESLDKIARLAPTQALPAHGPVIEHARERVNQILDHHEGRKRLMLEALGDTPRSAYDVALDVFGRNNPRLEGFGRFMALTETLAHLELLTTQRQVDKLTRGERIVYQARKAA